jgi:hypothetical protein
MSGPLDAAKDCLSNATDSLGPSEGFSIRLRYLSDRADLSCRDAPEYHLKIRIALHPEGRQRSVDEFSQMRCATGAAPET